VRLSLKENGVEIGSHEMETSMEMSSMQLKVYLSDPIHFSATHFNVRNFFLEQYDETCEVSYSGDSCQCPPIYVKQKDSSGSLKRSGTAAHDHCIEKGGYLAFFINKEEFDDFKINYRHGNEDLWLGYTQKFPENKNLYVSADGEDARFLKWDPTHNEPNGVTEQCVELYGQNTWRGWRNNMNDRGCGEQREFFCRFSQQGDCEKKIEEDCFSGMIGEYHLKSGGSRLHETVTGLECQRWDASEPHLPHLSHLPAITAHNFCSDHDGYAGGAWCYTTDPDVRWETCAVNYNCS